MPDTQSTSVAKAAPPEAPNKGGAMSVVPPVFTPAQFAELKDTILLSAVVVGLFVGGRQLTPTVANIKWMGDLVKALKEVLP